MILTPIGSIITLGASAALYVFLLRVSTDNDRSGRRARCGGRLRSGLRRGAGGGASQMNAQFRAQGPRDGFARAIALSRAIRASIGG
jgi:hypothetical protein